MATVQKATIDLFDRIYPLIEYFDLEGMSRDDWFTLLSTRWSTLHDHFGYVLMEEEKVVGFLGAFFHERTIGGAEHALCNLFCWYVPEEYRKESLFLILAILNLKNTTVTSLTPSPEAGMILERFKFKPLESQVEIFPLLPSFSPGTGVDLVTDRETLGSLLTPEDRILFDDHTFRACRHLLLVSRSNEQKYCYIMYNTVRKKKLRFSQVYSISNREIFVLAFARLQWFFFKQNRTVFTVIDTRLFTGGRPGPGIRYTLRYPRLYRSADLEPEQIDNLYTELLFMRRV